VNAKTSAATACLNHHVLINFCFYWTNREFTMTKLEKNQISTYFNLLKNILVFSELALVAFVFS
jgi:hypothetical protein